MAPCPVPAWGFCLVRAGMGAMNRARPYKTGTTRAEKLPAACLSAANRLYEGDIPYVLAFMAPIAEIINLMKRAGKYVKFNI